MLGEIKIYHEWTEAEVAGWLEANPDRSVEDRREGQRRRYAARKQARLEQQRTEREQQRLVDLARDRALAAAIRSRLKREIGMPPPEALVEAGVAKARVLRVAREMRP